MKSKTGGRKKSRVAKRSLTDKMVITHSDFVHLTTLALENGRMIERGRITARLQVIVDSYYAKARQLEEIANCRSKPGTKGDAILAINHNISFAEVLTEEIAKICDE